MSHYFSRRPWREYGLLPTSDSQSPSSLKASEKRHLNSANAMLPSFRLPKRYTRLVLASLVTLGVLCFLNVDWRSSPNRRPRSQPEEPRLPYPQLQETPPESDTSNLPPLYEAYREYEDHLSELRVANRTSSDRYIFFANHAYGCGWGNVLQETAFDALLAARANIGYVWDDYTWDNSGAKYSEFNGKTIASRVPLSTMLGGHILGHGPRNESDPTKAPRAISSRVYDDICPQHERVMIERDLVKAHLQSVGNPINIDEASGADVLGAWLSLLDTPKYKNARCIEVRKNSFHVIDYLVFGSTRVQSLWDSISDSPVLSNWGWSPLIHRAFEKNVRFFATKKDLELHPETFFGWLWYVLSGAGSSKRHSGPPRAFNATSNGKVKSEINPRVLNDSAPLPVLVLHLRRGDFEQHCQNLAEWSSTYTGFNSFPASRVRDGFDVPRIVEHGNEGENENDRRDIQLERRYENDPLEVSSMDERKQVYARHCFPDTRQVVKRVREVVRDYAEFAEDRERARKSEGGWWMRWWIREASDEVGGVKRSLQHRRRTRTNALPVGNESLKKIYIMTNGNPDWLVEVKKALLEDAEGQGQAQEGRGGNSNNNNGKFEWVWEGIYTSRDLQLGWEEKPVAQALDMYVAQRAEVFVGNGFSSLSSNIVMLRMKFGFDPVQTRFW